MKSKTIIVQYQTRPECADENEAQAIKVFDAFARASLKGVSYRTMREVNGNRFFHIVTRPDVEGPSPLMQVDEFREFVAAVRARCDEAPVDFVLRQVGEYEG